jgi:hypothetical protein
MAPVQGAPARLGERSATGFRTEHAQKRGGMRGTGTNLDVDIDLAAVATHTTVSSPEALELQDHWLQVHDPNRSGLGNGSVFRSGRTATGPSAGPGGGKSRHRNRAVGTGQAG